MLQVSPQVRFASAKPTLPVYQGPKNLNTFKDIEDTYEPYREELLPQIKYKYSPWGLYQGHALGLINFAKDPNDQTTGIDFFVKNNREKSRLMHRLNQVPGFKTEYSYKGVPVGVDVTGQMVAF
jgi:hypothetical protein